MDSHYAFATAHIHEEIYKRQGLLTSAGKEIKNKTEILVLLRALFLPKKVSIIHCPGHQKGNDLVARGNCMADEVAKQAALGPRILSLAETPASPESEDYFQYSTQDLEIIQKLNADFDKQQKSWKYKDKIVLPKKDAFELVTQMHRWTHLGHKKIKSLI